jgi:single-strand DNA-binding protein
MESAVNKVVLSGFAGADAEVKIVGPHKMAKVNLAINEAYKNASGEEMKKVNWFTLTFWNAKAELAEAQIKKGTGLTVEGRLEAVIYDGKDGKKHYTTNIIVNELVIRENEKTTAF